MREPFPIAQSRSQAYWEARYANGGNSGSGSYGRLAIFKAKFLNSFVLEHCIASVVEYGCGDGNQLSLAHYPCYVGLDISPTAIALCSDRFTNDASKKFHVYPPSVASAELALSLDVIFHLVEDAIYEQYMTDLFDAAQRFVIIYSSNQVGRKAGDNDRHRRFTDWVSTSVDQWQLRSTTKNPYPFFPDRLPDTSFCDFYVFEKRHRPYG